MLDGVKNQAIKLFYVVVVIPIAVVLHVALQKVAGRSVMVEQAFEEAMLAAFVTNRLNMFEALWIWSSLCEKYDLYDLQKPNNVLEKNYKETQTDGECNVCYDVINGYGLSCRTCKHEYHNKCIDKWLRIKTTCPACRQ